MKSYFIVAFIIVWHANILASDVFTVSHHALYIQFLLKENRIHAIDEITIKNITGYTQQNIPILLYRLLNVESVADANGSPLKFAQSIRTMEDEKSWQVNAVTIELLSPLAPSGTTTLTLDYGGYIFGYPEIMQYVRDRIDEEYSLIRPDALAYPMLAEPSSSGLTKAYESQFTFEIEATVPSGYVVAGGGSLEKTTTQGDSITYYYRGMSPTWRMDVAVAKFKTLEAKENNLRVMVLSEDEQGGVYMLQGMKRVIDFYSSYFGTVKKMHGFTAIEIPDGWGSQANGDYFLQAAAAFKDSQRISEMYHEISHMWNVRGKDKVRRCRYFDEAFGSYFESLAEREFRGEKVFIDDMEKSRDLFIKWVDYDKRNGETPIAEYWKEELGRNSYTKGAWSLYVLHQLVGENSFRNIIRTLLSEYADKPVDFKDFQGVAERVSKKDLKKFFDEWIYGVESSKLLADKIAIKDIVERYR